MAAAAAQVNWPADERLEGPAFTRGCEELGIDHDINKVIRAFGYWEEAAATLAGERRPETARQRSIRRANAGKQRQNADYFTGVRTWDASGPLDESEKTYNEWLIDPTRDPDPLEASLPFVSGKTIRSRFNLSWPTIVAIARDEIKLDDALSQETKAALVDAEREGAEGLIGLRTASLLLGDSAQNVNSRSTRDDFPVLVAIVQGLARGTSTTW
jgi:hypothetical protein